MEIIESTFSNPHKSCCTVRASIWEGCGLVFIQESSGFCIFSKITVSNRLKQTYLIHALIPGKAMHSWFLASHWQFWSVAQLLQLVFLLQTYEWISLGHASYSVTAPYRQINTKGKSTIQVMRHWLLREKNSENSFLKVHSQPNNIHINIHTKMSWGI